MNQQLIFTIIIPAYQRPKMLAKALESILVQSSSAWELIVVDDGSETPIEPALASQYADPRIRWFRQPNQGPGAARSLGVSHAKGGYICFLDDDDYFLPNHLDTVLEYLEFEAFPELIIRTPLAGLDADNKTIAYPNYHNDQDALLQYWKAPCGITSLVFPIVVFKRCPIDPAPRIIEDFAWVNRVLTQFPLVQLPDPATVIYVQHGNNRTLVQSGTEWAEARINVIKEAYALAEVSDRVPVSVYNKMLLHQWCHAARQAALSGERQLAWRLFRSALTNLSFVGLQELAYTVWVILRK